MSKSASAGLRPTIARSAELPISYQRIPIPKTQADWTFAARSVCSASPHQADVFLVARRQSTLAGAQYDDWTQGVEMIRNFFVQAVAKACVLA